MRTVAEALTRYTCEIWDRTSPVNGVAAEVMLARGDVPEGGAVAVVKMDGHVVWFQPHRPDLPGFVAMTEAEALALASEHARKARGPGGLTMDRDVAMTPAATSRDDCASGQMPQSQSEGSHISEMGATTKPRAASGRVSSFCARHSTFAREARHPCSQASTVPQSATCPAT